MSAVLQAWHRLARQRCMSVARAQMEFSYREFIEWIQFEKLERRREKGEDVPIEVEETRTDEEIGDDNKALLLGWLGIGVKDG